MTLRDRKRNVSWDHKTKSFSRSLSTKNQHARRVDHQYHREDQKKEKHSPTRWVWHYRLSRHRGVRDWRFDRVGCVRGRAKLRGSGRRFSRQKLENERTPVHAIFCSICEREIALQQKDLLQRTHSGEFCGEWESTRAISDEIEQKWRVRVCS